MGGGMQGFGGGMGGAQTMGGGVQGFGGGMGGAQTMGAGMQGLGGGGSGGERGLHAGMGAVGGVQPLGSMAANQGGLHNAKLASSTMPARQVSDVFASDQSAPLGAVGQAQPARDPFSDTNPFA